jgi:hypothetical protein
MTPEMKVTREELRTALDRLAQAKLGVSGDAIVERYNAGTLHTNSPTGVQLEVLARLVTKPL